LKTFDIDIDIPIVQWPAIPIKGENADYEKLSYYEKDSNTKSRQ